MTVHGPFELHVVAVVRVQEICAHQQEDDAGAIQMFVDRASPFSAGTDLSIVPRRDAALPLQDREVSLELITQESIPVRVREEDFDRLSTHQSQPMRIIGHDLVILQQPRASSAVQPIREPE